MTSEAYLALLRRLQQLLVRPNLHQCLPGKSLPEHRRKSFSAINPAALNHICPVDEIRVPHIQDLRHRFVYRERPPQSIGRGRIRNLALKRGNLAGTEPPVAGQGSPGSAHERRYGSEDPGGPR